MNEVDEVDVLDEVENTTIYFENLENLQLFLNIRQMCLVQRVFSMHPLL